MALLSDAVQKGQSDAQIAALERQVGICATERREAVDSYRAHLLAHNRKTSAANGEAR